jgi:hypothetical protein
MAMSAVIPFPDRQLSANSVRVVAHPLNHFRYDVIDDAGLIVAQTCCFETALSAARSAGGNVTVFGPPEAFTERL